jgi:hypothetical protein
MKGVAYIMLMKLTNIPVGIIKKSNKPGKLLVIYKYKDTAKNFDGYACSTFDKNAFSPMNADRTMYQLEQDADKKVCLSFKNDKGQWRNKWMEFSKFTNVFDKSRKPKQHETEIEDDNYDFGF